MLVKNFTYGEPKRFEAVGVHSLRAPPEAPECCVATQLPLTLGLFPSRSSIRCIRILALKMYFVISFYFQFAAPQFSFQMKLFKYCKNFRHHKINSGDFLLIVFLLLCRGLNPITKWLSHHRRPFVGQRCCSCSIDLSGLRNCSLDPLCCRSTNYAP